MVQIHPVYTVAQSGRALQRGDDGSIPSGSCSHGATVARPIFFRPTTNPRICHARQT